MRIFGHILNAVEVLISANVVVFILTITFPEMMRYLALQPAAIFGQPWTIITSMFVHSRADFNHILFNMIALFFFGRYLEGILGEKDFLRVYFAGGLVSGIVCLITAFTGITDPNMYIVGASGAIFAVGATLAILRPHLKVILFPIPIQVPLYIVVFGIWVVMSFDPHTAWQGHMGGLIAGVIYGYHFKKKSIRGPVQYGAGRYY